MGENSKIEWCDHTFNPFIGCSKVSAGCEHCYAEKFAGRFPAYRGCWGVNGRRVRTSDAYWRQPLKWDREAAAAGERRRVFCGSLCDILDSSPNVNPMLRIHLAQLIADTPYLDWLLLTKRPQNHELMQAAFEMVTYSSWCTGRLYGGLANGEQRVDDKKFWLDRVWWGVSVENQAAADARIPALLKIPAAKRFLSVEPMLSEINFRWTPYHHQCTGETYRQYLERKGSISEYESLRMIDWVICGGESGPGARPMPLSWARYLLSQCKAAGVPFFMKQMPGNTKSERHAIPDGLMIREYPHA